MSKLYLQVGDEVETAPGMNPVGFVMRAKVIELDSHPFEHDEVLVELINGVGLPPARLWVSEKYLTKVDGAHV